MTRARRSTPLLSRLARASRRFVRSSVVARIVLGAVLFVATPSTATIVEDALDLAGLSCCDDESQEGALGDCCPGGESHCAGCVHPTAIVPDALLALSAPFEFDIAFATPVTTAPTASHRTPPFRPPSV